MLEVKAGFKSSCNFDAGPGRGKMKIAELASRAGRNASAIRYYEKVGLLGNAR
jgi:hypothetical protein